MLKKNYVVFMSAGTMVAEDTTKEIDTWDINVALKMSKEITERHNSHPYGFYFMTRGRNDNDLDSKVISKSGMYYINGIVETLAEIKAKHNPKDAILISNMECNGWNKVVRTCNPYSWTQPLREDDVVVNI